MLVVKEEEEEEAKEEEERRGLQPSPPSRSASSFTSTASSGALLARSSPTPRFRSPLTRYCHLRLLTLTTASFSPSPPPPHPHRLLLTLTLLSYKPTGGGDLANYSFGLRQQLYALFRGRESDGIVVTDVKTPSYGAHLSASTFCGVLPGWGWSGRMEDAVLHGCIPVILQDEIHTPWESVLDAAAFSLRVSRVEMPSLLQTLRAVPPERVARMQRALAAVWPRFSYLGVAAAEAARRQLPVPAVVAAAAKRDAVATLLQVLRARVALRRAREQHAARLPGSSRPPAALQPRPGCEADAGGGDVSLAPDASAPEMGFEGRLVNGWVI